MSLTPDPESSEDHDISVSLEIYPADSSEVSLRQVAVGMTSLVMVSVPADGSLNLVVSLMDADEAIQLLSLAQSVLHNYLATEGK